MKANNFWFKQRGSALISAMLMMSIVTLLAVGMITRQSLEIRRADSLFTQERMLAQIAWVELWGMQVLSMVINQLSQDNDYITTDQIWALPLEEFQREGLVISGEIIDLQSRFNINNVFVNTIKPTGETNQENTQEQTAPGQQTRPSEQSTEEAKVVTPADFLTDENLFTSAWAFARLLQNQGGITALQARALAESTLYWGLPEAAEVDAYYLDLAQPYRSAHQPLWSASELRLVQGMDNLIYTAIYPYITALPVIETANSSQQTTTTQNNMQQAQGQTQTTTSGESEQIIPVNINTTSPQVLAAILNLDLPQANTILGMRPYYTQEAIQDQVNKHIPKTEGGSSPDSLLSVTSHYFLVRAVVRDADRKLVQYSLLQRDTEGKIHVVRRIQGEI